MRYYKTLDIHRYGPPVREGVIKLQSGQWIACGEDGFQMKSRFHSIKPNGVIVAFHGPDASAKYNQYCQEIRAEAQVRKALERSRQLRLNLEG